jgi:hypothetical protein
MLLDPERRISGKLVREELTRYDEGPGGRDFEGLRRLIHALLGPRPSKAECRRRRTAARQLKDAEAAGAGQEGYEDEADTQPAGVASMQG